MATKSSSNNQEHQQACKRGPADLIKSNLQDETVTTDQADDAATKAKALVELNQSIISRLEKVIKDDPIVDLWPNLREVTRHYKAERKEYIEGPRSRDEGK
jgi:hypothetical protein